MPGGNPNTLSKAVRDCIEQVRRMKTLSAPLAERIRNNDLKGDFLEKVRKFLVEFDDVRAVFDRLPLKDAEQPDRMPSREKKEALELFPVLIREVEELAADQTLVIETLKKGMKANSDQMELMRKAKTIFDKFVKKPRQDPKFFDVQS